MKELLPVRKAKQILETTSQNVYLLIKRGRLKGFRSRKYGNRWLIPRRLIDNYLKTKHDRKVSTLKDRKRVFNPKKDSYNLEQAAKYAHTPRQHFYYLIRKAKIPYEKVGSQYILRKKTVEQAGNDYWGVRTKPIVLEAMP